MMQPHTSVIAAQINAKIYFFIFYDFGHKDTPPPLKIPSKLTIFFDII